MHINNGNENKKEDYRNIFIKMVYVWLINCSNACYLTGHLVRLTMYSGWMKKRYDVGGTFQKNWNTPNASNNLYIQFLMSAKGILSYVLLPSSAIETLETRLFLHVSCFLPRECVPKAMALASTLSKHAFFLPAYYKKNLFSGQRSSTLATCPGQWSHASFINVVIDGYSNSSLLCKIEEYDGKMCGWTRQEGCLPGQELMTFHHLCQPLRNARGWDRCCS